MKKELANDIIRNDFTNKTILTDKEKEVLSLYIGGETIVKIADLTKQGTATVSTVIASLKKKYKIYKEFELTKLRIFQ